MRRGHEAEHTSVGASGRTALLERLVSVEGADLYDAQGKRLGKFIELVGGGDQVAIRHEGALVWRRRVLPAAIIAAVLPEHGARGAVVLNVDHRTLDRASETRAVADHLPPAEEGRVSEQELGARLAPYVTGRDSDEDAIPSTSSQESLERYLLFIPTPHGYQLVEQDGPAPAAFDDVSLPGHDKAFRVIKVARSPLPDDRRMCAYLERK
jgi:hypothetical protein